MRPFSTTRQRPTLNALNGNKISFSVCVNVMSIVDPLPKLLSIYTHNSQWSPRITKLNMRTPEVLSVNWNKIAPSASRAQKKTFWSDFRILAFPLYAWYGRLNEIFPLCNTCVFVTFTCLLMRFAYSKVYHRDIDIFHWKRVPKIHRYKTLRWTLGWKLFR